MTKRGGAGPDRTTLRVGNPGQLLAGHAVRWWRVERILDLPTMLDLSRTADVVVRQLSIGPVETLSADERSAARQWLPTSNDVRYTADRYTDENGKTLLFLQGHC
ncbi:hypothetical protein [Cryptosporangium japonicum]